MEKFTKYTESWERPGGLEPRAAFRRWSGDHQPPSHSVPPAVAGKVAARQGPEAYRNFSDGMFKAYFTENRTISDTDVIVAIAGETGLDQQTFVDDWNTNTDEVTREVFSDYYSAVESEITGVPAVVVDRKWLIPGAVDTDNYRSMIAEAQQQAVKGETSE